MTKPCPARADTTRGSALIIALVATVLLGALGIGLVMIGNTEGAIAANSRTGGEALYAADAAAEHAVQDLLVQPRWDDILSGTVQSWFVDHTLTPTIASNERISLTAMTADLQRRSDTGAPWGLNNPQWRLFAYGPLSQITGTGTIESPAYLVVWLADDPSETDGNPSVDANGVVTIVARALGLFGSVRTIEVTMAKTTASPVSAHVLSWREIR